MEIANSKDVNGIIGKFMALEQKKGDKDADQSPCARCSMGIWTIESTLRREDGFLYCFCDLMKRFSYDGRGNSENRKVFECSAASSAPVQSEVSGGGSVKVEARIAAGGMPDFQ